MLASAAKEIVCASLVHAVAVMQEALLCFVCRKRREEIGTLGQAT